LTTLPFKGLNAYAVAELYFSSIYMYVSSLLTARWRGRGCREIRRFPSSVQSLSTAGYYSIVVVLVHRAQYTASPHLTCENAFEYKWLAKPNPLDLPTCDSGVRGLICITHPVVTGGRYGSVDQDPSHGVTVCLQTWQMRCWCGMQARVFARRRGTFEVRFFGRVCDDMAVRASPRIGR